MILFSVVEVFNKAIGLLIVALLARVLSPEEYGTYLTVLIIFGYVLEFSLYGSQNRHNADLSQDFQYLATAQFRARRGLAVLTSCLGFTVFLVLISEIQLSFYTWPLLLTVPLTLFAFDYVAYVNGRSNIIVVARFMSQVVALVWVVALMEGWVLHQHIYVGNLLQSLLMTLVVMLSLLHLKLLNISVLFAGIANKRASFSQLFYAVRDQTQALSLRMLTLALVTGELILLGVLQSELSGEVAIAIRVIQVLYPFVVFYVDSKISDVSQGQFERFYLKAIFSLIFLLVLFSPWLVRLLFGESYSYLIFTVALFTPAFLLQAVAQYFLLLSLKLRNEKYMLVLLICINIFGLMLCGLIVQLGADVRYLAAIFSLKAAILLFLLPGVRVVIRIQSLMLLSGLVVFVMLLEHWGYYQYALNLFDSILVLFNEIKSKIAG